MLAVVMFALTGVGLLAVAVMGWSQSRLLRSPLPAPPARWPGVSILKPLRGVDDGLEENLASFHRQDYPDYEIVYACDREDDPAVAVARRVIAAHPGVPARLVVDTATVGPNPKVNNLAIAARRARHRIFLISDSNVVAHPSHLRDLVAHLEQPGVGLVSAPFRATGAVAVGSALESLQLNTFVMGGVAAMDRLVGLPCVVGKSMMIRRGDLDRIGGFPFLGAHLAEDQVCGEEIHARGLGVRVAAVPVENVLGRRSFREFVARHLRWARIRRHISPGGYAAEVILNPIVPAAVHWAVRPGAETLACLAFVVAAAAMLSAWIEGRLGLRRRLLAYPLLELVRQSTVAAVWIVPFLSRRVEWRGRRFHIGRRTALVPVPEPEPETEDAEIVGHPTNP